MTKEINLFEYLTAFSALRTNLSDFYLKTKPCRIFGSFDQEENARGLLLTESAAVPEILFLTAEKNDPAVKKELIDGLAAALPKGTPLRYRIQSQSGDRALAEECGFREESILNLFRTVGAGDERLHETFREYEKMTRFLEKRGYETVSFDRLSEEARREIAENPDGVFDDGLHPGVLMEEIRGTVSETLSFATLKDGKVAAYTIVRCPDGKNVIFEIICVAEPEKKSGVFILPFLCSLHKMEETGADKAFFAIYEQNKEALPLVRKRFSRLIVSESVQWNMIRNC